MTAVVYHNPRCSKSRQTVKLLEQQKIDFTQRLYLETPPTEAEIRQLLNCLAFETPRQLMRTKEALYQHLALDDIDDESVLIQIMSENPQLIERPIVVIDNQRAKIGRPPESVLALFEACDG